MRKTRFLKVSTNRHTRLANKAECMERQNCHMILFSIILGCNVIILGASAFILGAFVIILGVQFVIFC